MNVLMYDPDLVEPMREELTKVGFVELLNANEVNEKLAKASGLSMLVVNSVCGCAAGSCRPGVALALQQAPKKPSHLFTVFAGQDPEATSAARALMKQYPPSSPSIAFFQDGKPAFYIPRQQIEGQTPTIVAQIILEALQSLL